MSKVFKATVSVEYVQGHLRYGHLEMNMNEEDYKYFLDLSESDKIIYLRDGELIVDEYEVYDYGDLEMDTLEIEEVK